MCIGIPMCVVEAGWGQSGCRPRDGGEVRQVDMVLVGDQPVGTWVLVFLGAAREVLDEATAHQISDALMALDLAMRGGQGVDHLFADLVDREPQLPDFLKAELGSSVSQGKKA